VIETIVFDFGNVIGLFDYDLTLERLRCHTDLSPDEIRAAVDATDLEDAYESGRVSTAEFLRRVRELCRLRCSEEIVSAAWCEIFRPNEEVCALVPRLRPHYRLLLGSNTNELHAGHFRCQFAETLAHFDALVLSHEVGARKPRPEFFHHCQRLAGCGPEGCLFIDDLPANVEGARACGWHGIVYRDVADLKARLDGLGIRLAPTTNG
jgi:putative hydrolase of the HAD superfamily